ncbi:hypothetical protein SDC9_79745 [bioreactor metagenome]|uniref:Uncharacterized protein n=1 Tax=bioreactor metagenome TaxID=1076179 RepID=A0A644YXB1_9ZZZZ
MHLLILLFYYIVSYNDTKVNKKIQTEGDRNDGKREGKAG